MTRIDDAPLILVGLPGAGKSTVGRGVADRLGWSFVDLDEAVEAAAGRPVAAIFELEGEAGFRAREREATRALVGRDRIVISPGGGWMDDAANVALLRPPGRIIHLLVGVDAALARMGDARTDRPLLAGPDPRAALLALQARRAEAYATADLVLDTEVLGLQSVIATVVRLAPAGRQG